MPLGVKNNVHAPTMVYGDFKKACLCCFPLCARLSFSAEACSPVYAFLFTCLVCEMADIS